jgi:hypothetical protein
MGRRRDANRAEAIARGVGALVLLGILFIMIQMLPRILKGKRPEEMMPIVLKMIIGFAGLACLITLIGLIVWVKVRKAKEPPRRD